MTEGVRSDHFNTARERSSDGTPPPVSNSETLPSRACTSYVPRSPIFVREGLKRVRSGLGKKERGQGEDWRLTNSTTRLPLASTFDLPNGTSGIASPTEIWHLLDGAIY